MTSTWLCLVLASEVSAQWDLQPSGTTARLRGLSVVSEKVGWACGTQGTFVRTTNGQNWVAKQVEGAGDLDFRDVHAFDSEKAVMLAIGPGEKSRIYRTVTGGDSWIVAYKETDPKAFLDAIAFWDDQHGIALGDPVDWRFLILSTSDGGITWTKMPSEGMPTALKNEGAFAASGTCLVTSGDSTVWFGTGGAETARIFRSNNRGKTWTSHATPLMAGKPTMGVFSLAILDTSRSVAVGGAYDQPSLIGGVSAWTTDGWKSATVVDKAQPAGFRSAVVVVPNSNPTILIAVGPSGSDISHDEGRSWKPHGNIGFHAVGFASPRVGWAVGDEGRIARCSISP